MPADRYGLDRKSCAPDGPSNYFGVVPLLCRNRRSTYSATFVHRARSQPMHQHLRWNSSEGVSASVAAQTENSYTCAGVDAESRQRGGETGPHRPADGTRYVSRRLSKISAVAGQRAPGHMGLEDNGIITPSLRPSIQRRSGGYVPGRTPAPPKAREFRREHLAAPCSKVLNPVRGTVVPTAQLQP